MNNEEKIMQMLSTMDTKIDALRTDMESGFSLLRADITKNFADLADSQAHITEVVGAALGDLPASVQELKDVTQQLTYDYVLVKKRIAL